MKRNESAELNDLKRQLELIKQSAAVVGGNLDNQISGMALLMQDVARTLKLPADQTMRQLPAWAATVMAQLPAGTKP